MAKRLAIDESLLDQAHALSEFKSPLETVEAALRKFILRRQRKELAKLFGQIDCDPAYNDKTERRRRDIR